LKTFTVVILQEVKATAKNGSKVVSFDLKNNINSEISKCLVKHNEASDTGKKLPLYFQIDIDTKEPETVNKVIQWCHDRKLTVYFSTETRGGYHIVFDRRLVPAMEQKNINTGISTIENVELLAPDQLLTIPGTYQGGFAVCFADWLTDKCNNNNQQ
jgi:hypothetical protein